ncbi:MAG: helix-turn-helix transcriptional regulator [Prevotella sp.]|nr:helix-turn-helix transcriptional regulator [Prevotella sp.]
MTAAVACLYVLLRRSNSFAADVEPSLRLRHWAAAFFGVLFASHVWWVLPYFYQGDRLFATYLVADMLDGMTIVPTAIGILLVMLQDRRRPVWPAFAAMLPIEAILVVGIVRQSLHFIPMVCASLLLVIFCYLIYMVFAVRQYGQWLRDNYADLEHKEVWQSFVVLGITLMTLAFYGSGLLNIFYEFVVQLNNLLLIGLILWRVETLQKLDSNTEPTPIAEPTYIPSNIGKLLEQHCEATQLYLQHDLSLAHLSVAIGTNRTYLSSYFAQQGITYNIYINRLRIQHFVRLFRENVDKPQKLTAQQLAQSCGFTSYSTFSLAFKKFMRQTATAWMKEQNHHI